MRAILVATGQSPATSAFPDRWPTAMLPLADRPWVQHVVESLARQGFAELDVILSHLPRPIVELLGDGRRWGVRVRTHLVRDAGRPLRNLRAMDLLRKGLRPVLLARADRLPLARPAHDRPSDGRPVIYLGGGGEVHGVGPSWTGWAWLTDAVLPGMPLDLDESDLADWLRDRAGASAIEVESVLDATTCEGLIAAQSEVVSGHFPGLMLGGTEVEPGAWISRNVRLHPTARIVPPAYLSEDCRVGAGVQVGPGAVVGRGCLLDDGCTVVGSVILPGTYVGPGLELVRAVVDRDRLVHTRLGVALEMDGQLLSALKAGPVRRRAAGFLTRALAAALLAGASPVLLAAVAARALARRGPATIGREAVRLPAPCDPSRWTTYRLRVLDLGPPRGPIGRALRLLPGLLSVARGDLGLVGLPPRSTPEILDLPEDWRAAYLRGKAGLITEAMTNLGPSAGPDEHSACEACYASACGFRHDVSLLLRFLRRALVPSPEAPAPPATPRPAARPISIARRPGPGRGGTRPRASTDSASPPDD